MNFLPAERGGEGRWRVAGSEVAGPANGAATALFGIRPEDLVVADGAAPGRLAGEVAVVEPLGPHTLLTVRCADRLIRVTAEPDTAARPGETVHLEPRQGRVRWFEADSGRALAA